MTLKEKKNYLAIETHGALPYGPGKYDSTVCLVFLFLSSGIEGVAL
jgi:hypothetical protein